MTRNGVSLLMILMVIAAATIPLVALFAIFIGPLFAWANIILWWKIRPRTARR